MKVGDLVRVRILGTERIALVIIVPQYLKTIRIQYTDTGQRRNVRKSTLEVISESR